MWLKYMTVPPSADDGCVIWLKYITVPPSADDGCVIWLKYMTVPPSTDDDFDMVEIHDYLHQLMMAV